MVGNAPGDEGCLLNRIEVILGYMSRVLISDVLVVGVRVVVFYPVVRMGVVLKFSITSSMSVPLLVGFYPGLSSAFVLSRRLSICTVV